MESVGEVLLELATQGFSIKFVPRPGAPELGVEYSRDCDGAIRTWAFAIGPEVLFRKDGQPDPFGHVLLDIAQRITSEIAGLKYEGAQVSEAERLPE